MEGLEITDEALTQGNLGFLHGNSKHKLWDVREKENLGLKEKMWSLRNAAEFQLPR